MLVGPYKFVRPSVGGRAKESLIMMMMMITKNSKKNKKRRVLCEARQKEKFKKLWSSERDLMSNVGGYAKNEMPVGILIGASWFLA